MRIFINTKAAAFFYYLALLPLLLLLLSLSPPLFLLVVALTAAAVIIIAIVTIILSVAVIVIKVAIVTVSAFFFTRFFTFVGHVVYAIRPCLYRHTVLPVIRVKLAHCLRLANTFIIYLSLAALSGKVSSPFG